MKILKLLLTIIKNLFLIVVKEIRNFFVNYSWKKRAVITVMLVAIIGGSIYFAKFYHPKEDTRGTYEALVQVVDQKAGSPEEDRRASLKAGEVIAIFPAGHPWTETERTSYLIAKIKIDEKDLKKLTESVLGEAKKDEQGNPMASEVIQARKYKLDVKIPMVNDLLRGQPYQDKVFDGSIIEEK